MKKLLSILMVAAFVSTSSISSAQDVQDFTLTDTKGTDYTLYDVLADGNWVVLDFFATWCGPCRTSTPALQKIWEDYGKGTQGMYVFGIDVDNSETNQMIDDFKKDFGPNADYPGFAMGSSTYSFYNNKYGSGGIPLFVLVRPNTADPSKSEVTWSQVGWGGGTEADLRAALAAVGIEDNNAVIGDVSLFPNPSGESSVLRINSEKSANMLVQVYNAVGQNVANLYNGNVVNQKDIVINTASMQSGVYFVQITSGDSVKTVKLQVAH